MRKQEFFIPFRLPGLNEVTNKNRSHWSKGYQQKEDVEADIQFAIKEAGLTPFEKPIKIGFIWYEPNARRDPDNITASKKFILDALQKAEIIPNDGQKWIKGFNYERWLTVKDKDKVGVNVMMTEVAG